MTRSPTGRDNDIRLLVEHLLVQLYERYGLSVRGATPAAVRLLEHYPWRGNVRELEAVLEQATIFRSGDWITPEDLDVPMRRGGDVADGTAGVARHGVPAAKAVRSWPQHEALRIVSERREVRRRDIIARCRISWKSPGRELAGLARLGLLHRIGFGRGARYVPLSFWLTFLSDAAEWAIALVGTEMSALPTPSVLAEVDLVTA